MRPFLLYGASGFAPGAAALAARPAARQSRVEQGDAALLLPPGAAPREHRPRRRGDQGLRARDRARPGIGRAARRARRPLCASGQRRSKPSRTPRPPSRATPPIRRRTGSSARSTPRMPSAACRCGRATIRPPIPRARLPPSRRPAATASTSDSTSCSAACISRPSAFDKAVPLLSRRRRESAGARRCRHPSCRRLRKARASPSRPSRRSKRRFTENPELVQGAAAPGGGLRAG